MGEGAVAMQWCPGVVLGFRGRQVDGRGGLGPPFRLAWAPPSSLPARYSTKWPKEKYFWIFDWILVGCKHIMFGVYCGGGGQIWVGLAKIQKWHNLNSDSMSPLCLLLLSSRKRVSQSGQHQSGSSWWGLGWGAKSWKCLVYKSLKTEAQSRHQVKKFSFDH